MNQRVRPGRLSIAAGMAAICLSTTPVLAQEYPSKSVRMVISFPAGGGSDVIARVLAQKLGSAFNQTVVPDNRAGASGNIAAELVARAPADGYTVLFTNSSLSISPAVYKKLAFDPVGDLMPISMVSSYPFVLVSHPSLPVKNVKDLVALAKSKPDALTFSSAGSGTMSHMAMELLKLRTGVKLVHLPYKGAAPAAVALMAGESQVSFIVMPVAQVQINAGKMRGLGVAAKTRAAVLPNLPTMAEAGVKDNEALQWNGLFAPARTPQPVLDRLYRETVKAIATAEVKQRFEAEGAEGVGSSPSEFAAFFKAEAMKWGEVARQSKTTLD